MPGDVWHAIVYEVVHEVATIYALTAAAWCRRMRQEAIRRP
jgi:hypothetical protein